MSRKLEDIFNECYEQLLRGESVESCLKRYPKEAAKLEPLLKAASTIHVKAASIQARPEFKWQTGIRLEGAFLYAQRQKLAKARASINLQRSWALALTIILAVLVASAGTAAASTQALPDEPLYPVKLATEQVRLFLTFSDIAKTELHARFAENRAWEIAQMAPQGESTNIVMVTERLNAHLEQAEQCACPPETVTELSEKVPAPVPAPAPSAMVSAPQSNKTAKLRTFLEYSAARNIATLEQALEQAPEESKPTLRLIIEVSKNRYERILKRIEERGGVQSVPESFQDEPQGEEEDNSQDKDRNPRAPWWFNHKPQE